MPVLGVCGDSWYAATQNIENNPACHDSEGKHFSEILANKLDYMLFTLARGAASNSCIRLQITEMVKRKVDFILIGTTSVNRIEYPLYHDREYDPNLGLFNINYTFHPDQSSQYFSKNKEVLASDTLTNIFGNKNNHAPVRSEEQREAIKNYYLEAYDDKFREQQDSWIIASGIQMIRDAKIPYLLLGHPWLEHAGYFKDSIRDVLYDAEKGIIPWTYGVTSAPHATRRWHTVDETQVIVAEKLYKYITKNKLLTLAQNTLPQTSSSL
jgi:hypothetical protein